ncbi:MAG: TerB family tellurite resistance protein [Candidatus Marinimicrobia bacterium]|nr:TerB family tellurite resistance protein [Candidatus Neomarinimicrobiota bacterium]MBL7010212.1 TerB family tellurite resistance protein [Candidatus Neomarinimicrobiota bacterium]MBL7030625.1 TerB family tellurite resistance protein [Candidatus Neomarinimicrobiota bacterium]
MLWGGLGWALAGPIGAIIGYSLAGMSGQTGGVYGGAYQSRDYPKTQPGDFIVSLLVLFSAVMKADKQLLKSELDYVKLFLNKQFNANQVRDFMTLLKDILKQDYPLRDVCRQIVRSMDHSSRLELIHVLFGLSKADGHVHPDEVKVIHTIGGYLNINPNDFDSIKAMFFRDTLSDYTILEIDISASDSELKKAYRKMASKYHPDKVAHLGEELKDLAEEKFKAVSDAYRNIKKERGN